jgi:two-component system phosphate regulon sensor histidine kinase PhoR
MTTVRLPIIPLTLALTGLFAVSEALSLWLFPQVAFLALLLTTTFTVGLLIFIGLCLSARWQLPQTSESERAQQETLAALARAEAECEQLRAIIVSVAEGLVIVGKDTRIRLINDAARRLLKAGERPLDRLSDLSRDPQVHRAFSTVLESGQRIEMRIEAWDAQTGAPTGQSGSGYNRSVLHLSAAPLRLNGQQTEGVVGAFLDITQLERLERMRQEFLTSVSHELRTPLSSIAAYVETLLNGGLQDQENSARFLHTVQRNVERMRDLVNDIAELSAIESGAVRLEPEPVVLRQLVDEIFFALGPRCHKQQVQLRNEVSADCTVTADRRRLEQILTNLVDNAIKFNRPGGAVSVSASDSEPDTSTLIKVRDQGIGIPAEHLSRVFERFYRVDKARSRDSGGTGLGLAIVKHLAQAHGGEASVVSQPGAGSEFTIRLPRRAVCALPAASHSPDSQPAHPASSPGSPGSAVSRA